MEREKRRSLFNLIRNDVSSYIYNGYILYGYTHILAVILDKIKKIKSSKGDSFVPRICLVTDNILVSNAFFLYGMLTNTYLLIIPTKLKDFQLSIANFIQSSNCNIIIHDGSQLFDKKMFIGNKIYIEANSLLTKQSKSDTNEILDQIKGKSFASFSSVIVNNSVFGVVSSGSFHSNRIYDISYDMVYERMNSFREEHQAATLPNTILVGKWAQMFGFFSLYPILNKNHIRRYFLFNEIEEYVESSIFKSNFMHSLLIFSSELRKAWDDVVLEMNKRKFIFNLNKYGFMRNIINFLLAKKLERKYLLRVLNVHIINNDFGNDAIDVFRISCCKFTSSYGTLEAANFIAYKNNLLFTSDKYRYLYGGLIKKNHFKYASIAMANTNDAGFGELFFINNDYPVESFTEDMCSMISENMFEEDGNFLCYHGKKGTELGSSNHIYAEDAVKSFKDSLLIRDIFIHYFSVKQAKTNYLLIEPRKELLDLHIVKYYEFNKFIKDLVDRIEDSLNIRIKSKMVSSFNQFRTISGRIALYLLPK